MSCAHRAKDRLQMDNSISSPRVLSTKKFADGKRLSRYRRISGVSCFKLITKYPCGFSVARSYAFNRNLELDGIICRAKWKIALLSLGDLKITNTCAFNEQVLWCGSRKNRFCVKYKTEQSK